ncbi:MAG: hypothetical protein ACKVK8_11130, partial [Rhodospirillales bacterium]
NYTAQRQNKATNMNENATTPAVPTDKMIRAAQHGCGLTPIEAVHVYQTMAAAFEDGDDTVIYDGLMENQKQTAILAAETVDIRAGNAVRNALK